MQNYENAGQMVFDDFKNERPDLYKDVVSWYPSGQMEITVKLGDGTKMIYDYVEKTTRVARMFDNDEYLDKNTWAEQFGLRLRRKIRIKCLSNSEVAEKVGITQAQLSRYLNGETIPSTYITVKLADVLECSVSELLWIK